MQNQGDIRIQLIELHLTIYNKRLFLKKKFRPLWRKSLKKWVISYFSNAAKDFDLIKLKSLPILCLHVNLSLAIDIILHQWGERFAVTEDHRLCYAMSLPKTELFDPKSFILRTHRRFGENPKWYSESAHETTSDEVWHNTFSAEKSFRKISLGSSTGDFCKKFFFLKSGLFW